MCVCLLLVRAKAKIKGNKYGATRSAGDYRRKVQLARLCEFTCFSVELSLGIHADAAVWTLVPSSSNPSPIKTYVLHVGLLASSQHNIIFNGLSRV